MAKRLKQTQTQENHKQKVTFTIKAPEAQSVQLAGDFTGWEQAPVGLMKAADGSWQKTIDLSPGTYEYRVLVDGKWQDDPQCHDHCPNPFGTENCVRRVGANA